MARAGDGQPRSNRRRSTAMISLRVTESERATARKLAEAQGYDSVSAWIRDHVFEALLQADVAGALHFLKSSGLESRALLHELLGGSVQKVVRSSAAEALAAVGPGGAAGLGAAGEAATLETMERIAELYPCEDFRQAYLWNESLQYGYLRRDADADADGAEADAARGLQVLDVAGVAGEADELGVGLGLPVAVDGAKLESGHDLGPLEIVGGVRSGALGLGEGGRGEEEQEHEAHGGILWR